MEFGPPFVINPGMTLMLEWHVLKWDIQQEVKYYGHNCWCILHGYYHGAWPREHVRKEVEGWRILWVIPHILCFRRLCLQVLNSVQMEWLIDVNSFVSILKTLGM